MCQLNMDEKKQELHNTYTKLPPHSLSVCINTHGLQSSPGNISYDRVEFLCANTMVAIILLDVSVTLGNVNGH